MIDKRRARFARKFGKPGDDKIELQSAMAGLDRRVRWMGAAVGERKIVRMNLIKFLIHILLHHAVSRSKHSHRRSGWTLGLYIGLLVLWFA